jgi:hypothetical protein
MEGNCLIVTNLSNSWIATLVTTCTNAFIVVKRRFPRGEHTEDGVGVPFQIFGMRT